MLEIISSIIALISVIAGAFFFHRTAYSQWIREKRSKTFSQFIKSLNELRDSLTCIINDPQLSIEEKNILITEEFKEIWSMEKITRLYLPKLHRDEFSSLVKNDIWSAYSLVVSQTKRLEVTNSAYERIQQIFEESIVSKNH